MRETSDNIGDFSIFGTIRRTKGKRRNISRYLLFLKMQSLLFVFIGLPENNSDANLDVLTERLEKKFDNSGTAVHFTRKDELLSARLDDISYYVSILKSKNELKDWYQLAIDFELRLDKSPINKRALLQRYTELILSPSNLYEKVHFDVGLAIMEEMEKFTNTKIFSFQ
jgi:hypothetical protein